MKSIFKITIICNCLLAVFFTLVCHAQSNYKFYPIYEELEGVVAKVPFYIAAKQSPINKNISSFTFSDSDIENLPEAKLAQLWSKFSESDLKTLSQQKILSDDEESMYPMLYQLLGKFASPQDIVVDKILVGNAILFYVSINDGEMNKVVPWLFMEEDGNLVSNITNTIKPEIAILSQFYLNCDIEELSQNLTFDDFDYVIELSIEGIPSNDNPLFLCFDAVSNSEISKDEIGLKDSRQVNSKVHQIFNDVASKGEASNIEEYFGERSARLLRENISFRKDKFPDSQPFTSQLFLNKKVMLSSVRDHASIIFYANDNANAASDKYINLKYCILHQIDGAWKIVNMFHSGPLDKILKRDAVKKQILSEFSNRELQTNQ